MGRLFEVPPKLKAARRVLMHVVDAGPGNGPNVDMVVLQCGRCGHTTDWHERRRSEAMRGVPCPKCNTPSPVPV